MAPLIQDLSSQEELPIQLAQDDPLLDRKLKGPIPNSIHIKVNAYQHQGDLLFATLYLANLGNKAIETLVDTGSTNSFIKKGVIPDCYMVDLETPYEGTGANAIPFFMKRQSKSLLLNVANTLFKIKFLEVSDMNVSDSILGLDFLADFDKYTFQHYPKLQLVLTLATSDSILPLFTKRDRYLATFRDARKRGGSREEAEEEAAGLGFRV